MKQRRRYTLPTVGPGWNLCLQFGDTLRASTVIKRLLYGSVSFLVVLYGRFSVDAGQPHAVDPASILFLFSAACISTV